jgi:SAM-dependent methyltransferase
MGYVFDYKDALACEKNWRDGKHQAQLQAEQQLILDMLNPSRGRTVLDIGCGIGTSLEPLVKQGLLGTGLDPSAHMLDRAKKKFGDRVELHEGFAEDLPFDDNSFDYACLIKTIEFVDDPEQAISEACRVARNKLFIGIVNRYSIKSSRLRIQGVFTQTVYNRAIFFSAGKLKKIIRNIMGDVPISSRTVNRLPGKQWQIIRWMVESDVAYQLPFGTLTGIMVTLVPRFRSVPLELHHENEQPEGTVAGLARTKGR